MINEYRMSAYQDYGPLGSKEHIHLVRNKNTGKICIKKELVGAQRDIINFRRENKSPFFPEIVEVIEDAGRYTIIEEYVEGITLEDYMMGEPLYEAEAVKIARQIGEALLCLHNAKPMIIYRDLKPENVVITPQQQIKLVDFDISRKYQQGKKRDTQLLGTAEYAAPEQFGYFQTDNRTDIYAFGVLFNYMLTGKFPIEYVTEGKYAGMVRKCVELEPDKRYQNVADILKEFPTQRPKAGDRLGNSTEEEQSWTLPGFRSGQWKNIVLATLGYALILYIGITIEFNDDNGIPYPLLKQWVNRVAFLASTILTVFFCCNYRNISGNVRLYRHPSKKVRILSYIGTWFLFVTMAVFFTVIIESIFPL